MRSAFIHGFAGTPATWDDIAPSDARRVTLPGHQAAGLGEPRSPTSWEASLDAIAAELGAVDLVVGYSLGARVALGLVAAGRVPRAILVGVNPGLADPAERRARRAGDARWAELLRTQGMEAFSAAWEAQALFATQTRADPVRLAARRAARRGLDPRGLAQNLEAMGLAEMPDYRAAVDARVTLVVGGDDANYLAIARALPAPLVVIDGAGHDPTLERPAELARALAPLMS